MALGTVPGCSDVPGDDAGQDSGAALQGHADTAGGAGSEASDTGSPRTESDPSGVAPEDTFFEGSEQVWLEARARGVTFRAIGQEPGWLIEFDRTDSMRIVLDYGAREMNLALPEPVVDSLTWVTTYQARTGEHTVRIDIRDEPCADVMSGERFGASVLLVVDGVRYSGCGRTLDSP